MFFSFDGIDGVGKTTQMQKFQDWLVTAGHDVVTCRDPGGTRLGERIREILLNSDESTAISSKSEMLLYMASRAQLVQEWIQPSLAAGKIVISDRYLLANIVYQGYAGGLPLPEIREVGRVATGGLMPDCVFLLDMPPREARARMGNDLDRIERRGDEYREKLRSGFLAEAEVMGKSVHVIDAGRSIDTIHRELCSIASQIFSSC